MYWLYVDESGDPGRSTGRGEGNSTHYILSAIVLAFDHWKYAQSNLQSFRKFIHWRYGFPLKAELHAAELIRINKERSYARVPKRDRIQVYRDFMAQIPGILGGKARILNVCIRKQEHPEMEGFQKFAWRRLIRTYEQFLCEQGPQAYGCIVSDHNTDPKIKAVLHEMREKVAVGPPNYTENGINYPCIDRVVEDIFFVDSKQSMMIQAADAIAHSLYRKEFPKGSLKRYNVDRFFDSIEDLLYLESNPNDPCGIVRS